MKKLILVFAALAITAGAFAQSDSRDRKMNQREMNNNQHQNMQNHRADQTHPDGVMMQNGKIMMVKNGQMAILDEEVTMRNGTRIATDGNFTQRDGRTMMLKEGQHIDMSGNLSLIKKDKDKNMYLVPDSIRKEDF